MKKRKINIDFVINFKGKDGQGVKSASLEDLNLLKEMGKEDLNIYVNKHYKDADIIHITDVSPQFYTKVKKKKITVMMVHFLPQTLDGSIKINKYFLKLFKKYVLSFYRKANELVTVNPQYVNKLVELGFKKENITYIPNYVSSDKFFPLSYDEKMNIREKYHIKKDAFVVMSCGQTQPRKGIYDFIELANSMPEITFIWVGGFTFGSITEDHAKIKKLIEEAPKNVKFFGIVNRDKLNDIYNMCDVFLSQSYDELFPMTILEASSVNLPIIVRDLSLYDEILFNNVKRCVNNQDFKRTISIVKNDEEERNRAIQNSKELSMFYSKEKVYAIWLKFYKSLIEKYSKEETNGKE